MVGKKFRYDFKGVRWAIKNKLVTYDLERLMKDATLLKCSEFADEINHGMTTEYLTHGIQMNIFASN